MAIESATRYLKTYGAVAVGLLGLVVAFNVVVDPYGVLPAMSVNSSATVPVGRSAL